MVLPKKVDITKEFIMSKVDSWLIYNYEIPNMKIGVAMCNPLRKDEHPSLLLKVHESGQIKHFDFANEIYRGDCVDFIAQKYGLNYDKALQKIAIDFGLIDGTNKYEQIEKQFVKPVMELKRYTVIQVTARKWNKADIDWWSSYLIPLESCKKEEIYPVDSLYVNRVKIPIKPNEKVYAYRRLSGFKVYFPERTKEEGRWLSNIPLSDVNHLENLSKDYNTLIVPSLKCYMVCIQLYPHVIQIQNESRGSLTPDIIKYINENSKQVFYGGNNDGAGKDASYRITKDNNWNHINPPDSLLLQGCSDWSDWSKLDNSLRNIERHFRKKNLI